MKTFEDICKMTQDEVKAYMKGYLASKKYKVINDDGFLYARGTVPVLLVAHMDTVHKETCKTINKVGNKLSSPQGIGGDDRCGVFIIMNIVKELNCSVLLCEDEEIGCIGAHKFTRATYSAEDENGNKIEKKYVENLGVNYMIEFDRKGDNDAVFYSCDNKEFIDFVTDATGFKFAHGSVSDISTLMPAAKLSAVNLSCGYYSAHTTHEYVQYDEMMDAIEAGKSLIKAECDEPFEYIAKKYSYNPHSYNDCRNYYGSYDGYQNYRSGYSRFMSGINDGDYYRTLFDTPPASYVYEDEGLANIAKNDRELELEVIIYGESYSEETIHANGDTKAECWMNLFLDNPNLRFNDIVDYTWG